ncbi:MAG: hypothetical protein PHW60_08040 [Kiritimatiellae bacterium]|nr:hypothetical protein [Kiritimatiellia bacterium]
MKHEGMMSALAAAITMGLVAGLVAQEAAAPAAAPAAPAAATCSMAKDTAAAKAQTLCPIMGGKCSKDIFVDAEGVRIFVCCKDCIDKVKADPKAAIAKIKANGEQPECVCVVCPKCGEYQGSDKCCKPDAVKCDKCKMDKDSPGCCKPDVLGKTMPCGLDASKCGMKAAPAAAPAAPVAAPAEATVPAATPAPAAPAEAAK